MLKDYLPILIQVIVSIGFVASALIASVILGKSGRRNATKDTRLRMRDGARRRAPRRASA